MSISSRPLKCKRTGNLFKLRVRVWVRGLNVFSSEQRKENEPSKPAVTFSLHCPKFKLFRIATYLTLSLDSGGHVSSSHGKDGTQFFQLSRPAQYVPCLR